MAYSRFLLRKRVNPSCETALLYDVRLYALHTCAKWVVIWFSTRAACHPGYSFLGFVEYVRVMFFHQFLIPTIYNSCNFCICAHHPAPCHMTAHDRDSIIIFTAHHFVCSTKNDVRVSNCSFICGSRYNASTQA